MGDTQLTDQTFLFFCVSILVQIYHNFHLLSVNANCHVMDKVSNSFIPNSISNLCVAGQNDLVNIQEDIITQWK